jgi:hypothetical protein
MPLTPFNSVGGYSTGRTGFVVITETGRIDAPQGLSGAGATFSANIRAPNIVNSVNGLTGAVGLSAGSNITITQSGNTLTIASTASGSGVTMYVETFNGLTGPVTGVSVPRHWFI